MAKFHLENIFYLDSQKSIFFIGKIIDGTIRVGMKIQIDGTSMQISGVESIDGMLANKLASSIALRVSSVKQHYLNLSGRAIIGRVLDISESSTQ